ncbi:uncharacterized protein LOC115343022 isoform X3 [Aquila chrysaetos chrysaetos]|uniref:uncharacterized protein LOC115343022 isoform X3 n=1 Tax=Aquila chrysaetos chrysaetos TaxID=223781 RepID=UPI0011767FFD|nr:uncharacterized protein LOC115343022 isoform X3 [Aquila chrysaetos chrysaetos]
MTAAGTSLRRSAMTQKTPEARRPAQRRAEERPAGPARRGPGPGLSPPAAPGSAAKPAFFSPTAASPSASHEENPAWVIPLAAQLDVSWHRFAVLALSSAMTIRDRWKESIVVCKYKPRVFSLSPFRLSPRPTGGGGASERSRGASLPAGVRPRHERLR